MSKIPPTPELDKIYAHKEQSQAIGEFLEWIQNDKKVFFCIRQPERIEYLDPAFEKECKKLGFGSPEERAHRFNNPTKWENAGGLVPYHLSIENIIAEFFGVDLKKAEKERLAILKNIREAYTA